MLGFTQATSERSEPVIELLRDLLGRGLTFEEGILCVIDGSKGLRKAIDEVFPSRVFFFSGERRPGRIRAQFVVIVEVLVA